MCTRNTYIYSMRVDVIAIQILTATHIHRRIGINVSVNIGDVHLLLRCYSLLLYNNNITINTSFYVIILLLLFFSMV